MLHRIHNSLRFRLDYLRTFGLNQTMTMQAARLRNIRLEGDDLRERSAPMRVRIVDAIGQGLDFWLRPGTSDAKIAMQVFGNQEYDFNYPVGQLSKSVIVDAGANVGYSVRWFAERFPYATIVAIEPDNGNANLIEHNARLTSIQNRVHIRRAALWPRDEPVQIVNPSAGAWAYRVDTSVTSGALSGVTPQQLIGQYGRIDILKIDIEGAERELFDADATKTWLPHVGCVVIETHDWLKPGCEAAVQRAMLGAHFVRMGQRGENTLYVSPQRG